MIPCAVTLSSKYTDRVTRDGLRRVSEKKLTLDSETNALMREQFSYLAGENGNTTEFVSKIEQTVGPYAYDLSYTYDSMGNVSQVRENGTLVAAYTYDSLNQLITEFNYAKGFKYTYEYDRGGNITTKRRICISDCSLDKEYTYTYASDWKDKLISFDGEAIIYDAIGNPTTYRGNQLSWSNIRRLESFGNNTYEYGADGIRTSKTVNCVKHNYTLNGNKIVKETFGSNTIKYFYGTSGVVGFSYNGTDYYYRKNLQGDILAIVNASGSVVTEYSYDAWGSVLSVTGTLASTIGAINPFRYRGYYYDTETKLYYLNSRYYDPEVGRFINADSLEYLGANGDFVNYNLFAVCMSMLPKSYKLHNILSKRPSERIDKHKNSFRSSAYRQLASYSTAKSGNTAVSSKETFIFANHVFRNHYTTPTAMLDFGPLWGKVGFSSTITKQNVEPGLFYSFSDIGLDQAKYGVGLNIVGWLGVNVGINTEGNAFVGAQVTPWLHAEASVGLDGIGITVGIDVEDTSFDFEIKLGLGTCAVIACIIFAPYAAPILAACLV